MAREYRWQGFGRLVLALVVLSLAGCGGGGAGPTSDQSDEDGAKWQAMGTLYGDYLTANNKQPPKDEQTFRQFLGTKQDALEQAGITLDEMFVSPRGQPLKWIYGQTPRMNLVGMPVAAYEAQPVDGKRLVITARGVYDVMDESRFRELFPQAP